MYRPFLAVLLCLNAASAAPQAKESDVTYVKINPVAEGTPVEAASSIRESRIEKLPLTIPGNISISDTKEPDKNTAESPEINRSGDLSKSKLDLSENKSDLSESKPDLSERKLELSENKSELSENLDLSESNQSDTLSESNGNDSNTTDDLSEISPTDDLSESNTENLSDTVPSETNQSDRRARNFDSVETTEISEDATEKYEDELIDHTAIEVPRTKAPPKFVSKVPKLSYFQKPRVFQSYSSNHVELAGKRKFRSRCSCQKIWNCPKLQITVPRCPNEYFLCCF